MAERVALAAPLPGPDAAATEPARSGVAPWIVLGAVAAAYAGSFDGTWQFDDWNVIVRAPPVQSLHAWWRSMPGIRPLLKLSFAVNHASGLGLAGFHAVNVAIHCANALLALALLGRIEARGGDPSAAAAAGGRASAHRPAASAASTATVLVAALAFALHPAQTEAVTYVSGRSTSLAAAFVLASALCHVAGRDGARTWLATILSPLLFACALGTKEYAAALPPALLLVEASDARRSPSLRAAMRATAGHWIVLAAAAAACAATPTYRRMIAASVALRGPWENLLTHLHGLAWLAGQVVRPGRLDADPVLPVAHRLDAPAALAALVVAGALAAGLALLRRRPAISLALLWTVLWLSPTGWVIPRPEPANDRQLYLALLGPAWLLGRAVAPALARSALWRAALAAALLALAATTWSRNRVYEDEVRFWQAVLASSPSNARAHNNLAVALAARCRLGEAEAALRRAVALDPDDYRAGVNLRLLLEGEPLGEDEPRCAPAR